MACPKCGSMDYRELHTKVFEDGEYRWVVRCHNCGVMYTKKIVRRSVPLRGGHNHPVIQLRDGEAIAKYGSITEASRLTGISKPNISRCCGGCQKTAGGFEWGYDRRKLFTEDKEI